MIYGLESYSPQGVVDFLDLNKELCLVVTVLEMKIWIYWSESNSWIYFYIVLKKLENLQVLGQRTSAHSEDCKLISMRIPVSSTTFPGGCDTEEKRQEWLKGVLNCICIHNIPVGELGTGFRKLHMGTVRN